MDIVFFGSGRFAVKSLEALIKSGHSIALVVTQPDKPKGRRLNSLPTEVKIKARELALNIYQPQNPNSPEAVDYLQKFPADVFMVIAYGHILKEPLLGLPKLYPLNVHASLLPKYRGAAPINRAIINGEKETGVTTMLMDEGMDTGNMLLSERMEIKDNDTASDVHDRLKDIGAGLLMKTINCIKAGVVAPLPQDNSQASYAPVLKKEDGRIDWTMGAAEIRNLIRGMNPWPGAYTRWEGMQIKVFRAKVLPEGKAAEQAGTILNVSADGISVATGKGTLVITELQPENRDRMIVSEFIKGYRIGKGQILD